MTTESTPSLPSPPKWLEWALIAAVPVLCFAVGGVFLPSPKTASESRQSFDRSALGDVVQKTKPSPSSPVDVVLGERIRVLGADVPQGPLSRGRSLDTSIYFEPLKEMDRNWQIFSHIDREGGTYRIHGDHWPADGAYHTSLWRPGEYVKDSLDRLIPIDAPPGRYEIWIGFYIGDERLPFTGGDRAAHDGSNRVRVGQITVK